METERGEITTVVKEMGLTHNDFYHELPHLLHGIPYRQSENTVTFKLNGKKIEKCQ